MDVEEDDASSQLRPNLWASSPNIHQRVIHTLVGGGIDRAVEGRLGLVIAAWACRASARVEHF